MTSDKKEPINVWSPKFAGGPKNLGDPDDNTLRHVEEFVYVNNIVQERAHREKCADLIKDWGKCMEANKEGWQAYLTWLTCKPQVDAMNVCLKHYYKDPAFKEECTKIYLEKRKRYRETGVIEKMPNHKKPYYESTEKQEFLDFIRKEKQANNSEKK